MPQLILVHVHLERNMYRQRSGNSEEEELKKHVNNFPTCDIWPQ